jgi:hypothetical protein
MRGVLTGPIGLWVAFLLVHAWLGFLALTAPGWPLGDVQFTYSFWVDQAIETGRIVGIDTAWVYPPLALVPIFLPAIAGMESYAPAWLTMIAVLDAAAIGVLTGWGMRRDRLPIAWWWLGFLVLLGPIAVGRIDAVTVAMGVAAAATILTRPAVAGVLLAAGAWIKIWPAGILAVAVVALRSRLVLLVAGVMTSLAVLTIGALAGGSVSLLSFITEQTGRGLQIEAVIATPWIWAAMAGVGGVEIAYSTEILTFQVSGPGTEVAAAITTPLLALAAAAVALLSWVALRRGASAERILPPAALGITLALIVCNKVGSPQFTTWLAVPIILALVVLGRAGWRSWRTPIVAASVIAGLTQAIYPFLYDSLLAAQPFAVMLLTARNALSVALFIWTLAQLGRIAVSHHPIEVRSHA